LYSPGVKDFQARIAIGGDRLKRVAYIRFKVHVAAGIKRHVKKKNDSFVAPVFVFVDFIRFDNSTRRIAICSTERPALADGIKKDTTTKSCASQSSLLLL
jgi:hypothetical protein